MPCYCTKIDQYNSDLGELLRIRDNLNGLSNLFHDEFGRHKTELKDFFRQSNPAFFEVNRLSGMVTTIDDYEKNLTGYGGAWENILTDIEADIQDARNKISEYTILDSAFHAEEQAQKRKHIGR